MDPRRAYPRIAIAAFAGNLAFIGAWVVLITRTNGWLVIGPILLAVFALLRVGGMWLYAARQTENLERARRAAIFTTFLTLAGIGLWVFAALRGPRISL
ncbi:hypothetical protein [Myxococcus stipitatus]|uniref:hypothetical protein n=1 Tax=Myxococcus stipitatus TaxID=83455 RepID=UPI0030D06B2B